MNEPHDSKETSIRDGIIAALSERNPKIATRNRKWIAKIIHEEQKHEKQMAFISLLREDKNIKWLLILAGSMAGDLMVDTIQGAGDVETGEPDYWSVDGYINFMINYFTGGYSLGANKEAAQTIGFSTVDNPWSLAGKALESCFENLEMLAVAMLVLNAVFGGNTGKEGGGITGIAGAVAGLL